MIIKLYFIFSIVFISLHSNNSLILWRQMNIIRSWWEIRCIICGTWEVFFCHPLGSFSHVFWFYVFDQSLWLFSSHGFHILCRLSSISLFSLGFIFSFSFSHLFSLFLVFYYFSICTDWHSSFFLLMVFTESEILEGKGLRFKLVTLGVCSKSCLLRTHVGPSAWMLLIKI